MSEIIPMTDKALPEDCVVFKHSTTCPISAAAAREVRAMTTGLPIYWVNVREQRDISNWIAATYEISHASPQLILVKGGRPVQTWSHYDINRANVS